MEQGRFPGYRRSYVNEDYVKAVIAAGGVPLLLPLVHDENLIEEQMVSIDGLILSGGHDISSLIYGEQPSRKLGETLPERDQFDLKLFDIALKKEIPVLGICRGMQLMNVALGGTLYQDLDLIPGCDLKHDQYTNPSLATHDVILKDKSLLAEIFATKNLVTNSFHHLAIKTLGKGFIETAHSSDGVIEGIELAGSKKIIGVQWHPEMMALTNDKMLNLFKYIISKTND